MESSIDSISSKSKYFFLAYKFLHRYRYINCIPILITQDGILPLIPKSRVKDDNLPIIRVVIIGAGISGLVAAVELENIFRSIKSCKLSITILESRERPGGRLVTLPIQSVDSRKRGVLVDLGIIFFIQGANSLVEDHSNFIKIIPSILNLQLKLSTTSIALNKRRNCDIPLPPVYESSGALIPISIVDSSQQFTQHLLKIIPLKSNDSCGSILERAIKNSGLDLKPLHFRLCNMHFSKLERSSHSRLDDLSASYGDRTDVVIVNEMIGMVPLYYESHLKNIQENHVGLDNYISNTIIYSRHVNLIQTSSSGCKIKTSEEIMYNCNYVVFIIFNLKLVTVPLGVLQNEEIRFDPDLHDDIKEELWGVGLGALNRAVMVFGYRFWPVELSSFEVLEKQESDNKSEINMGNIRFESIESVSNIAVLVIGHINHASRLRFLEKVPSSLNHIVMK
jgi:hypothetical protein